MGACFRENFSSSWRNRLRTKIFFFPGNNTRSALPMPHMRPFCNCSRNILSLDPSTRVLSLLPLQPPAESRLCHFGSQRGRRGASTKRTSPSCPARRRLTGKERKAASIKLFFCFFSFFSAGEGDLLHNGELAEEGELRLKMFSVGPPPPPGGGKNGVWRGLVKQNFLKKIKKKKLKKKKLQNK